MIRIFIMGRRNIINKNSKEENSTIKENNNFMKLHKKELHKAKVCHDILFKKSVHTLSNCSWKGEYEKKEFLRNP